MSGRSVFAVGFAAPLVVAGAIFLAVWKYLDRMEAKALGQLHPR